MKTLIKNLYYSVNENATKYFFYLVNFLTLFLAYLNASLVYMIFSFAFLVIFFKIYMGFVLTSHLIGKFVFIIVFLLNSLPYISFIFRDFKSSLFSWSELCLFLVFSFQVIVMVTVGTYDFFNYVVYHRFGIPCNYFAERVDTTIENVLLQLIDFISVFFL